MDRDRFRELATEHLLSGLTGSELKEFEAELGRLGDDGERELDQIREALGTLALTASPATPPPELKERLMAEIRRETRGVRPAPPRAWIAVTALAASIALVVGIANLRLQGRLDRQVAALDSARAALVVSDSARQALKEDFGLLAAPQGEAITLTGTPERPGARARAFVDPSTGRALLLVFDLPILPADSLYQLWTIERQAPASVGTFTVDADGRGRLELEDAVALLSADLLAVTVEPAPGVPAPTGEIVLSGSL